MNARLVPGTPPRLARSRSVPVWACAAVIVALGAWWMTQTPPSLLRDQLRLSQFWILESLFVALLTLTAIACRKLTDVLTPRDWATMAALILGAVVLVSVAPRTNRIYYDEHIYQGVGQNLSDLHLAQMCNDGTTEYGYLQCWRYEYNKQPYGYPYLLSTVYRLAGTSDVIAHRVNVCMAAGSALAIFLIVLLATEDRGGAAMSGLALILMPEQLRWSHSAASEPSTTFFCSIAVLAAVSFCRARSVWALAWVAVSSSFASYFRPEAMLIVPIVAGVVLASGTKEILNRVSRGYSSSG